VNSIESPGAAKAILHSSSHEPKDTELELGWKLGWKLLDRGFFHVKQSCHIFSMVSIIIDET
jgi:hypothetical protein